MDTHLETWKSETRTSPDEQHWYSWIKEAEKLAGHSLDGDNSHDNPNPDGYSMDEAYESWETGCTPEQYVNSI
ncbi:MAG: hypothetical protein EOO38_08175 [Cytophagaceae bacterium]|nr:MAG: hypothetical protein EOO38_08175 [Cytophagaceae bacterium]